MKTSTSYTSYVLCGYGNYQVMAIRCKSKNQENKVLEILENHELYKLSIITHGSNFLCDEFMTGLKFIRSHYE